MPAPTPSVIVEAFATAAGGSYITNPIPVPSTGTNYASFHDGFPPVTMTPIGSGGEDFQGQDLNGILYMITAYLAAQTGGQFWPYNATWSAANTGYAAGAIVAMAAGNGFWINTFAGNTNNPDTAAAISSSWVPLACYGSTAITGLTNANVTLTAPQAASPLITLAGTLTGNVQIIFPLWLKTWRIINLTTGAYTVTCKTPVGNGTIIPPFGSAGSAVVYGDGVSVLLSGMFGYGIFTATLSGMTATTTGTLYWSINGNKATLYNAGAGIYGTSNTNDLQVTGIPSFLFPLHTKLVATTVVNEGFDQAAALSINASTSFQFQLGVVSGSYINYTVDEFLASGLKGIPAGWTQSYTLD